MKEFSTLRKFSEMGLYHLMQFNLVPRTQLMSGERTLLQRIVSPNDRVEKQMKNLDFNRVFLMLVKKYVGWGVKNPKDSVFSHDTIQLDSFAL